MRALLLLLIDTPLIENGNESLFDCSSNQRHSETKPMKISASSKANKTTTKSEQSGHAFEDVNFNDNDDSQDSPPVQYVHSPPSKSSHPKVVHRNNNSNRNLKPDHCDQQMLLHSMMEGVDDDDDDDDNDDDQVNNNVPMRKSNRSSSHRSSSNNESSDVFLLLDANEHLTVCQSFSFDLIYFWFCFPFFSGKQCN